ncbi:carboxypeptidase-like regulatory domain-containing protein [Mucilaginibacter sp. HMF5004]|uniref:carboxypeptidase-like regulatory domain-containing protein n=1 Tax=Mucilaginibacter rivuli TaxID=2857527 RepID=UPI001C5FDC57|nr:carboxypeptidase-like regulatory domain-containing protein [Mucilaginibacter rivuli]MBW4889999.1 carboxypeptidase-like regulatory domain-containing protein [Mucilaginibacter rivuli]
MRRKTFVCKLILMLTFATGVAFSQAPSGNSINTLISKINTYNGSMPVEKTFLQFDKPYYSIGDTAWFKGYLTTESIGYSPLSSRLYVELLNDSNAVVKRFVFPVAYGLTWGSIPLSKTYINEGTYTIRAYTSWMRNFGDDYFFKQSFYINNQGINTWLVNVNPTINSEGGKDNVKMAFKFTSLDDKTAGLRDMNLKILNGKKVLLRNTAQTAEDGTMTVDFNLPPQTTLKNLNVVAQDKLDKTKSVLIPISVNRPQDVDIQFMPESASLIESIPARVGFKAIGEDGKGINVQAVVYDNDHTELANITNLHHGIGTFDITPQPGKTYTAEVTLPDGAKKTVNLPAPLKTGSVLRVKNIMDKDTMTLSLYNTSEQATQGKYSIVGLSRGVVCYAATFAFSNNYFSTRVSKSLFPTGVAHFILLNAAQQPVNERITFINHNDNLKIELNTDAKTFSARDSIPVHITVKDATGKPVEGSFSMAVTDDNQVKEGSSASDNIVSHLLLSSDLKGYVEDPTYYFTHDEQAWKALDALLLTQGWIGYDLKKIDKPVKPEFDPEVDFSIKGTVTNLFNKPIASSKVLMLAKGSTNFVKDTVTNAEGRFAFNKLPQVDNTTFIISARKANGKVVNGGVSVDDKNETPAKSGTVTLLDPWNVNTDATVLNYIKSNKAYKETLDKQQYGVSGKLLNAVNVRDRALIKGSQSLNGPEGIDQTLTEDVLVNAGTKATLLDVLSTKITGFRESYYKDSSKQTNMEYFLKDKRLRFVFDGVDLDRFYEPFGGIPNEHHDYQKQYLDYILAQDILGVEVIYRANSSYNMRNLTNTADLLSASSTAGYGADYAYLEITTRAGNGPFIKRATGIYLYKPLPIAEYKQFYRPRYAVKNVPAKAVDLRSTIHWEPNIITQKDGTSTVSFYAADKPTHYTVILEGTDLKGRVGYQTQKITIGGNAQ